MKFKQRNSAEGLFKCVKANEFTNPKLSLNFFSCLIDNRLSTFDFYAGKE